MRPKPLFSIRPEDKPVTSSFLFLPTMCLTLATTDKYSPSSRILSALKERAEKAINCNNDKILHKYYK